MRVLGTAVAFLPVALFGASNWAAGQENSRLQPQVDAIFAAYNRPDSPGCAVGIVGDGVFVCKRGYSVGNIELESPLGGATSRSTTTSANGFAGFADGVRDIRFVKK